METYDEALQEDSAPFADLFGDDDFYGEVTSCLLALTYSVPPPPLRKFYPLSRNLFTPRRSPAPAPASPTLDCRDIWLPHYPKSWLPGGRSSTSNLQTHLSTCTGSLHNLCLTEIESELPGLSVLHDFGVLRFRAWALNEGHYPSRCGNR